MRRLLWLLVDLGRAVMIALVVLLLIEGGLRLFGYQPRLPGPYDSYFQSDLFQVIQTDGQRIVVTNPVYSGKCQEAMLHRQRFAADKPQGVLRVFAVGGSSAFGWGMERPLEQSFASVFGEKVAPAIAPVSLEVMNLAGLGFGSFRVNVLLRDVLRFQPDLVLVYCGNNEFWEYPIYRALFQEEMGRTRVAAALRALRLVALIRDLATTLRVGEHGISPNFSGRYQRFDEEKYRLVRERFRENLLQLIRLCREHGATVIFSTVAPNLRVRPTTP